MKNIKKFSTFNENSVSNYSIEELESFFEEQDFNVHMFEQDGEQGAKVETWTDGGVNMIFTLLPFTKEEFINRVDDFDINLEILKRNIKLQELHRQGQDYKNTFTIRKSLEDFTNFQDRLKEVVGKLK